MKLSEMSGKELKEWRESRAWQRSWLAIQIGVSAAAMWKWEKDDSKVPLIAVLACEAVEARLDKSRLKPTKGE